MARLYNELRVMHSALNVSRMRLNATTTGLIPSCTCQPLQFKPSRQNGIHTFKSIAQVLARRGEVVNAEETRQEQARRGKVPWKKWGPYLSERQWGTVREDYSDNGNAWDYFSHDQARSCAYRWGEDGWTGIIARMMHLFAANPAEKLLEIGKAVRQPAQAQAAQGRRTT